MKAIRIAVAGAGMIGRRHMELVAASGECSLAAVADPAPAAVATAGTFGVARYVSLAELIARERPDGVIVATPNALHVEHALACIDAGIPVLVEKPVAHTLAAGAQLLRAADGANARVLVGHHRAHSPLLDRARAIVEQGILGQLVGVMGSAVFYKPAGYFDEAPWRRAAGGGPILINLIHEIGNLRSLCGEILAVQALASNSTRGFEVEDTVAIGLRFANGALGTFLLSDTAACARSWEQTTRENASYATYPDEDCYVIMGTRGCLSFPTMRIKRYTRDEDRSWWKPMHAELAEVEHHDPLQRQLAHFCALVRGETQPLVTLRDGLANLRVTEAIATAARSGDVVHLEVDA